MLVTIYENWQANLKVKNNTLQTLKWGIMVENLIQNFTHEGRYIQANQNISTSLFYTQTLNLSGEAVAVFKISTKDCQ